MKKFTVNTDVYFIYLFFEYILNNFSIPKDIREKIYSLNLELSSYLFSTFSVGAFKTYTVFEKLNTFMEE